MSILKLVQLLFTIPDSKHNVDMTWEIESWTPDYLHPFVKIRL